jgi:hypothetical protein
MDVGADGLVKLRGGACAGQVLPQRLELDPPEAKQRGGSDPDGPGSRVLPAVVVPGV